LFFSDQLNDFLQTSVGLALLAGALGTMIRLKVEHERWILNISPDDYDSTTGFDEFLSAAKTAIHEVQAARDPFFNDSFKSSSSGLDSTVNTCTITLYGD
jgi:hypothetical protein